MSNKRQKYNVNNGHKKVEVVTYDFPQKPEPRSFSQFIYDSKSGAVFGRTAKNWGQLTLFYIIFYIVLSSLFAICLQGLFATLSDEYPKWRLEESLIGTSPGVNFRPQVEVADRGTLVAYRSSSVKDVRKWVKSMNEFLNPYTNTSIPIKSKRVPCSFDKLPKAGEVCKFEIDPAFGDCADNTTYGFNTSAPCLYLKLNKIYGWVPDYYSNPADLPSNMPDDLQEYIRGINNTLELNQVWVSCAGRRNDTVRDIKFMGPRGFPGYFYPFMNLDGYQSPLVPIQVRLEQHFIEENELVQIECRTWAKNIVYSGSMRERQGSVLIEMQIEK